MRFQNKAYTSPSREQCADLKHAVQHAVTEKFHLTTGPIIQPSANYDHFFLVPNVPLYKPMVVGPDNATVPLLRIRTTFIIDIQCYSKSFFISLFCLCQPYTKTYNMVYTVIEGQLIT